MTLKSHPIAPKCILFSKKFPGLYPEPPFKRGGERGRRRKEGVSGLEGGEGKGGTGDIGVEGWEGDRGSG
jgi:hypothetical protein